MFRQSPLVFISFLKLKIIKTGLKFIDLPESVQYIYLHL